MSRQLSLLFLLVITITFSSWIQKPTKTFTICIDAGHGGKDPGAMGKKTTESKLVLAMSLELGRIIKENLPDVKIMYTRDKDEFIPLFKRGDVANEANADLFISLHCNASTKTSITGTESYVLGLHASDKALEVATFENNVIMKEDNYQENYEGFDINSPETIIMIQNLQAAYLKNSIVLASKIEDQFVSRVGLHSRGVKQAGFIVLWKTNMPSVLIETGFISNPDQEAYLMSEKGQVYICSAIYRAVRDYKQAIEK